MSFANVILLSLDPDTMITSVSSSADKVLDLNSNSIQKEACIGRCIRLFLIGCAIIKQLGHFHYEWTSLPVSIVATTPQNLLPELPGSRYFLQRPAKPSTEAEPQEFTKKQGSEQRRIHFDRSRESHNISNPIALLVSDFGKFQTNIKKIEPSLRAILYAQKMVGKFFDDEAGREQELFAILG
ncbi:uncharacterized protein C8R40DRAFT_1069966 [Lentinula edodes]|uniref:uncharacterized protein n=1 Tax=Lentinula edodes TaxID=5353 RepID=UPI001E8D72A1|nr:uncharacterized protein C8R40DRAFT_1069966 [Lentinula edodes]KAH7874593.1 hypothetical protein C8R40DRAFT_1069966 [Lentinula edodes]